MNERIKKLLFQAGVYDGRDQLYWSSEEQLEEFAELIVNATCNVILHYDNVDEGVAVAKKQFGVTE